MKRSLLICLSVLLALAAVAVTALAVESHSVQDAGAVASSANGAPRITFAHLAPFDTETTVTIKVDGVLELPNVAFGDSTSYITLTTGTHTAEIYTVGSIVPVLTRTLDLVSGDYTALVVGGANGWDLDVLLLEDDNEPIAGALKVRLGHLAPFTSSVAGTLADVRRQDGTLLIPMSVPYGTIADYASRPPGTYDLKVTAPGGTPTLIDPMPAMFGAGEILSVFAVGDGANQPLGIFVLPSDQKGFFLDLAAALQLAHLAPFASDAAVTVWIDGEPTLPDLDFADSTGYLPLTATVDHLVEIVPSGAVSPVFSTTINLDHPQEYTAIAIGGASGWGLGLELRQDDNTPPETDGAFKARLGHLAPFAPTPAGTLAEVRRQDGMLLLPTSIPYGTILDYAELEAEAYDLKITAPGGAPTLIDPLRTRFAEDDIVSVFAVGDGTNQPLGVFALPAGEPGTLLPLDNYRHRLPVVMENTAP